MKFWPLGTRVRVFTTLLCILFVCSGALFAQAPAGRLHGQITDQTGAVIPGASITVKNSSGLVVSATSDGAGSYDVKNLPAGKYTISVTAKGFAPTKQEVEIATGQNLNANIPMEILIKEENIEVQSDAAKVSTNPDNNSSSVVITGKDLDALSDDPDELQQELQALAGPSAGPNGGQIYIDGFTGGELPPKSSIREIRINQNPFSAEYDRMGFGRIEILTKPGTDKVHGQFFINDNHSFMDALNPFAATEPNFDSQIYSGNVGGPLGKKASYQINAERRNIDDAAIVNLTAFQAAGLPVVGVLNPRVRTNFTARLDYQLSSSNTVMVRYQFTHNHEENDGVSQLSLPSQGYDQTSSENTIQVSDTQVFGPHVINETRFEWQRDNTGQNSLFDTPQINVQQSFIDGGNPIGIGSVITNHYEVQNYTSINKGNHFMRLGGRLRDTANTSISTQNFNATYSFGATRDPLNPATTIDPLTNFHNGQPTQLTITTGNPLLQNNFVDVGLYAEDDWKVRPNMTLSYGLRYETQNDIAYHGNWAPRVGFAWGLGGKKNAAPKTVIRTGFGMFYDRFPQNLVMQSERQNGINQQQLTVTAGNTNSPADVAARQLLASLFAAFPTTTPPLNNLPATLSTTYGINPGLQVPYTVQFAGSVERQLTKTATLTGTFLHSHGVHQLFSSVLTTTPVPQYQFESGGVFNQNQFIANFNMRVSTKLTIFSFYMFGHANANTFGAGSFPSNPVEGISADYGRSAFDVRQRLFLGGTVSLPHGFRVSPFMVANAGAPFNITTGLDNNEDSIFNDRPSFATDLSAPNVVTTNFGNFNKVPITGQTIVPVNFGNSPSQFTLNMRVSKTFGIGPKIESANNNPQQAGQRGGGQGGIPGGARPGGAGAGGPVGGPRGGGGAFGGGPERSN
ncbi:MAG TPA: carboxypeptidase regulatory-like domain-containing protein, partial [Candidatus Angelobacter sp.]|nr:carboxypeptidase regulatory-like domain-containing protein [Candidatus Angelobacter sp.]